MANIPRANHFVPQVLSKNFTREDGKLWYFSACWTIKQPSLKSPKSVFHARDIYNLPTATGDLNPELEHEYSKMESEVAPVLDKIIKSIRSYALPALSKLEKAIFDRYFYHQTKRVPDFFERFYVGDIFQEIREEAFLEVQKKRKIPLAEFDKYWEEPDFRKTVKVAGLQWQGPQVLDYLSQQGLGFVYSGCRKDDFILGSNPIYLALDIRKNEKRNVFPVASDVLVVVGGAFPNTEIMLNNYDRAVIRRINHAIAKNSSAIAARNKETVQRLINTLSCTNG